MDSVVIRVNNTVFYTGEMPKEQIDAKRVDILTRKKKKKKKKGNYEKKKKKKNDKKKKKKKKR